MKFCPVIPPSINNIVLPMPPRGMFAFATYCTGSIERPYSTLYKTWQATALQAERGPLVIDCPVYEGGGFLDVPEMRRVEEYMKPDFLIVPDVRGDMEATLDRFSRYAHRLGDAATGVLQGKTWMELEYCFKAYLEAGVRRIAIPKDVSKIDVFRSDLCLQIAAIEPEVKIHLLGADWPYVDEALAGKHKQVISFDSAEPFNAAYANIDLAASPPPSRPRDWLKTPNEKLGDGFVRLFQGNIEVVERLAKCS